MNARALPFRVCVFFACQPEEALTTHDVAAKFDVRADSVRPALLPAVEAGYLTVEGKRGRGNLSMFRAGPTTLRMLGRPA